VVVSCRIIATFGNIGGESKTKVSLVFFLFYFLVNKSVLIE